MPTIHVDSEQAALIEAAITMLEAALTARVVRADPDKVVSNSLQLQANKLATVRAHLKMPAPPAFSMLPESAQAAVIASALQLLENAGSEAADPHFDRLRGFVNAASIHPAA